MTDTAGMFVKPENIPQLVKSHLYDLKYPDYVPDIYAYDNKGDYQAKTVKEMIEMQRAE